MHSPLIALSAIFVLGIAAQWLAWRVGLPSILLLLITGLIVGPGTGLVSPEELFGPALFPLVSLSVALILFEGGLTLHLPELDEVKGPLWRLISIGVLATWSVAALAAHTLLGFSWELAILIGALLTVSGPTVVGPLLRQIRPKGRAGSVLKWEGILNDPVGALLAVLVYEVLREGLSPSGTVAIGLLKTAVFGSLLGWAGARATIWLLKRRLVPDWLQSPVTMAIALVAFVGANEIQHEAGLLSVTLCGVFLANQNQVRIKHIVEFKENLRTILLSSLFILLAARIDTADLTALDWRAVLFVLILIVVGRPIAVALSTWGTGLDSREKFFLCCMAPRGIVAAAVSAVFGLRLEEQGLAGAEQLAPITFVVIIGTVTIYGLGAGPIARAIGLASGRRQGVLMIGAHKWARSLAAVLQRAGIQVTLVDSNRRSISLARMAGLTTYYGSALSELALEDIDLSGIGFCIALTANDELNSLAANHFAEDLGRDNVFQLPEQDEGEAVTSMGHEVRSHLLGAAEANYHEIGDRVALGAVFKRNTFTPEFNLDDLRAHYGDEVLPLFRIAADGTLRVIEVGQKIEAAPGTSLISLVLEQDSEQDPKQDPKQDSKQDPEQRSEQDSTSAKAI